MDKPLGTARWAAPADVIARHEYAEGAFWLGRSPTEDESAIGFSDDRHVCLTSGSRAGKGTTLIVNNLVLWPGSLVVIDPKGENATVTAARRGPGSQHCVGMGQAVHVLDPFNAAIVPDSLRSRFNPLDVLDPSSEETIDEAGRIADALVVTNPESKDPFWDESARAMVKGMILHVLTSEEFEGRRNLITVRDLITRGDAAKVFILKDMGDTDVPSAHALLWEGVSQNSSFGGVIMRIGASFVEMYGNSPKQYESVRQVADRNTEFVDSPGMQRCLEASDFLLSDLKTKPEGVSLYLSLPQRYMNTHFRWLRMMIALTLTEMELTRGMPASGHRVLFCLDEFAGLKRMEVIENAVAQVAGHGVKLMFVLQSLEQLKGTYKDKWETFLANCGLKIFFGLEDYFTREYVSKFIGEMEVLRTSRTSGESEGRTDGWTHGTSRGESLTVNQQTSFSTNASVTRSRGESTSSAKGWNRGRSKGSNWGLNLGHNSSDGSTWKPHLFFGREDERSSDGSGFSQGLSYGRNKGTNEGENATFTSGRNSGESRTDGVSESNSQGSSYSQNVSENQSVSRSENRSVSRGVNESVHKRRLVTEDEIGLLFQRLTAKDHPAYPGLALVLAAGEEPMFVRKVNYYEDPQFINCYDPHPDHPFRPLAEHTVQLNGPSQELLRALHVHAPRRFRISEIRIEPGVKIRAGEPLFQITGDVLGKRTALIYAPVNAQVSGISAQYNDELSAKTLAAFTYYGDAQAEDNPYRDLEALVAAIEADWQQAPPAPLPISAAPAPKPKPIGLWIAIAAAVVVLGIVFRSSFTPTQKASPPSEPKSKIDVNDWTRYKPPVTTPPPSTAPTDWSSFSWTKRAGVVKLTPSPQQLVERYGPDLGADDWQEFRDASEQKRKSTCIDTSRGDYFLYGNSLLILQVLKFNPQRNILLRIKSPNQIDCWIRVEEWRFSRGSNVVQVPWTNQEGTNYAYEQSRDRNAGTVTPDPAYVKQNDPLPQELARP